MSSAIVLRPEERGNVLFLILIAVALFAALSYAVTSSNRTGGGNVSKETARANAAAIIQYGAALKIAVTRMQISNGCTDGTLNFANAYYKDRNNAPLMSTNSNAPLSGACDLFSVQGGSASPFIAPADALDRSGVDTSYNTIPGSANMEVSQVKGIGLDGPLGTEAANDIIFRINWINKETCIAINDILGNANPGGNPPNRNWAGAHGSYVNGSLASSSLLSTFDGADAFCDTVIGGYFFYQVVLQR